MCYGLVCVILSCLNGIDATILRRFSYRRCEKRFGTGLVRWESVSHKRRVPVGTGGKIANKKQEDKIMMLLKRNENWLPGMLAGWFDNDLMPKAQQWTTPAVNIKETDAAYELELAMPGMNREDIRLRLDDDGCLTVSVKKEAVSESGDAAENRRGNERAEEGDSMQPCDKKEVESNLASDELKPFRYLRREFTCTEFQKSFIVPENVDKAKISAKADNGVLTVEMPKMREEDRRKNDRTIEIH